MVLAEDGGCVNADMSPSNEDCMDGGREMGLLAVTEFDSAPWDPPPPSDAEVPLNADIPIKLFWL